MSADQIIAELDRAKAKRAEQRRLAPHPITAARMAVWQLTPDERRRYLRSGCGRRRRQLA